VSGGWENWDYSAWRRGHSGGYLVNVYEYLLGGVKADPDSSQWYPVTRQETMGTY